MNLTKDQIDRMVKDAEFVSGTHPYAPALFNDLCCHVKALACEVERLSSQLKAERSNMRELERDARAAVREAADQARQEERERYP